MAANTTVINLQFQLLLLLLTGTYPPLSGLVAELNIIVWIPGAWFYHSLYPDDDDHDHDELPDMVLKPVKTSMKLSPSRKTFNCFTCSTSIMLVLRPGNELMMDGQIQHMGSTTLPDFRNISPPPFATLLPTCLFTRLVNKQVALLL